ncbi:Cof-type HAD-IIB family hydrolase [Kluyvera sichuanensis]
MYKLVALDLDGTLLTSDKKITARTRWAIHQLVEQGAIIVLASGRTLTGIQGVLNALSLDSNNVYVIACNGAQIWSASTQHFISNQLLQAGDVHYIRQWGCIIGMVCYAQHTSGLVAEVDQDIPIRASRYSHLSIYLTADERLLNTPVPKVMFIDDVETINYLSERLPAEIKNKYQCVRSEPNYYEMMVKGVNKGNACRVLATYLDILPADILAIGNERNDCEMLRFAGRGIAMGNADDVVKRYADDVTTSNDEDGVASAIERFCLH